MPFNVFITVISVVGGVVLLVVTLFIGIAIGLAAGDTLVAAEREARPETSEGAPAVDPSTPAPSTERDPALSDRGNLLLEPSATAEVYADGKLVASMTVHSITVDPTCTGDYIRPPKNGHFVVMDATVQTGKYADFADQPYQPSVSMRTGSFRMVTPEGQVVEGNNLIGNAYGCVPDAETMPSDVNLGETASGKIVFDMPTPAGAIILPDLGVRPSDINGWEWEYPAR